MDQEKIGKFIKEIRTKDKLSQEKFGEKYGVTYQAVSKWENGKNIPDISILKEICNDYNKDINELLNDNNNFKKKNNNKFVIIPIALVIIIIVLCIIFIPNKEDEKSGFEFKTIKTTCDDFELSGSIAYDENKTSIYISNVTYCGEDNNTLYKNIECSFYEIDGKSKQEIDSYKYDDELVSLEDFLKQLKFNVDHYSNSCKMYKENTLYLEIKATEENDKITFYSIPLELQDNCK